MDTRKPKLLVVDDTPDNLFLMQALLEEDYDVVTAESGSEALEHVAGMAPDLILLDVMMPGMDGREVLRRLRARPETAKIPVIFLTALGSVDECRDSAVGYLAKPIDAPMVLTSVQATLACSEGRAFQWDGITVPRMASPPAQSLQ